MKIYNFSELTTAVQITPELKERMLDYLKDYQTEHPEEHEATRLLIGVLELHNDKTKDFLKFSDIEILNTVRQMYYYEMPIEKAREYAKRSTTGAFILQTLRDSNSTVTIARIRYRQALERLEEIKTALTGVHSIDTTQVKLENQKGNEYNRLKLIETKTEIERELTEYKATIKHAEQVRKDIAKWTRSEAPEGIKESIEALNSYDVRAAEQLLGQYTKAIADYAGMNEQRRAF